MGAFCAKLRIVAVQKQSALRAKARQCQSQRGMYPPRPKSLAVLKLRRRSPLKGCTEFASLTSSVAKSQGLEPQIALREPGALYHFVYCSLRQAPLSSDNGTEDNRRDGADKRQTENERHDP